MRHLAQSVRALALLALLLLPMQARCANIYFMGSEDIDFILLAGALNTTTCSNATICVGTNAYSRTAVTVTTDTTADPPATQVVTPNFGNRGSLWLHMSFGTSGISSSYGLTTSNVPLFNFYGSDGVRRLYVRGTGTRGQVKVSKRTAAGSFTDLVSCAASTFPNPIGAAQAIDIQLVYAVVGSITLYADGTSFCTYSGDVTTDSVTAVSQFEVNGDGYSVSGADNGYYSQVIVGDSNSRSYVLQTLVPQAAGTTQQWTSATAANLKSVSPGVISDLTFNLTATSSQISDWTIPALALGTWTPIAVKQAARISRGATGPQNFEVTCRPNGQADTGGGSTAPGTSFANFALYWATNCATASPWASGDFTGGNFGVRSLP